MDIYVDYKNDNGFYSGGASNLFYSANNSGIVGAYDAVLGGSNLDFSNGVIDELCFIGREITQQEIGSFFSNPNAAISGNLSFCESQSTVISATGGVSYLWNTLQTSPSIEVSSFGVYSVDITDSRQCKTTLSVDITELPAYPISISGYAKSCDVDTIQLSVNTNVPFTWENGTNTNPRFVTTGTFTATTSSSIGCVGSSTFVVGDSPALPIANFSYDQTNSIVIDFTNTSSNANSYFWDFGFGSISTGENATFDYLLQGVYSVTLIASNECGSDTITQLVNVNALYVDLVKKAFNWTLFPNPAVSDLFIKLDFPLTETVLVSIVNSMGQILISNSMSFTTSATVLINTVSLSSGFYVIFLKTSRGTFSKPFLKI